MIELTKEQAEKVLDWLTYFSTMNGDCAESCEDVLDTLSEQIESL